jgi:DNA-binding transcriptional regulator YbjK
VRGRRHRPGAQARRDALLTAAVEVAAEQGIGSVTHRSVTERAGLPLATVSYFFASIDQLAAEALQVFTATRTAELLALATALGTDPPDRVAEALAAATGGNRTLRLAQLEVYLHAARTETLRPAVAEAVAAFEQVAEVTLRAAGVEDPGPLAAAFVAIADGFSLRDLALPGSVAPDALHRAFRSLYQGSVLGGSVPGGSVRDQPARDGTGPAGSQPALRA